MAKGPSYVVKFRRRREGKTDYRKRIALLKSGKLRFVVRRTPRYFTCQFIEFHPEGDKVIACAHSKELRKFGWLAHCGNLPAAYLTGLLAGLRAAKKGIREAVLDVGLQKASKGNSVFACLKGALDAGIEIPHSEEVLPSEERIKGEHIASYAEQMKEEKKERFSEYFARNFDPIALPEHFEQVKKAIRDGVGA